MKWFLCLLFVICACNQQTETPQSGSLPSPDTLPKDSTSHDATAIDSNLYSIQVAGITISLQQWDSTVNLEQVLGKPLRRKTKELDQNSDTYAGSFTRELEYDGLKLKLFSPPQNGRTFWIQEIILTGNRYKTGSGIGIGDHFEQVKKACPALKKFPGINENMYYVADDRYEKSIEMEFEKERLKKLRMYYMLQ